jgi:hypothetical protein
MIVIVDMRGHSEIILPRIHAVIYRSPPSKHRKADAKRKRKSRLLVRNIHPAPPQVSIICKKHPFEETISHMKFDKRQDAAMYGRRLVPPRTTFMESKSAAWPCRRARIRYHRLYANCATKMIRAQGEPLVGTQRGTAS